MRVSDGSLATRDRTAPASAVRSDSTGELVGTTADSFSPALANITSGCHRRPVDIVPGRSTAMGLPNVKADGMSGWQASPGRGCGRMSGSLAIIPVIDWIDVLDGEGAPGSSRARRPVRSRHSSPCSPLPSRGWPPWRLRRRPAERPSTPSSSASPPARSRWLGLAPPTWTWSWPPARRWLSPAIRGGVAAGGCSGSVLAIMSRRRRGVTVRSTEHRPRGPLRRACRQRAGQGRARYRFRRDGARLDRDLRRRLRSPGFVAILACRQADRVRHDRRGRRRRRGVDGGVRVGLSLVAEHDLR